MQDSQLLFKEEQEDLEDQTGNEKALRFLQEAHLTQGNQINSKHPARDVLNAGVV